ncbi:hypothetical protein SV7mr_52880 [Stieleria bergensis]|uniref:DUF1552 domain-containing protein n=1 Tax=Stieleria bergensis TaxID=2528025 RepID=A0A517T2X2_9BACT|nr:hypothetical protein SV7mr_52880 [Planctomycetes bacterium SV_7m_r]
MKSWHLKRRTILKSAGVSVALPWMECMGDETTSDRKKRFFGGYFAYGVPMPADDAEDRLQNGWFPVGTGRDYKAPEMHQCIMPLRDKVTFLSGLSHPSMRTTSAHKGADVFLTGANLLKTYDKQSISIDQSIAQSIGNHTRYRSLVMSSMGGVNRPYRSSTLSFDRSGRPIPALNRPAEIFRRLFGEVTESERNALASRGSIIDEVLDEANSLNLRLGANDRRKLDDYLASVREVEKMTERAKKWQKTPKPKIDSRDMDLEVNANTPREYLAMMYDLLVLAFQTDSTRVATFQTAAEEAGPAEGFPRAIGLPAGAHRLSHEKKDYADVAKYIGFLNQLHADFVGKLDAIQEGDGTLLDNTLCFYGCATSKTHRATNYPIILSGGKNMGFNHGAHLHYQDDVPLANLFVTIANQLGQQTTRFADSTADISEVLTT